MNDGESGTHNVDVLFENGNFSQFVSFGHFGDAQMHTTSPSKLKFIFVYQFIRCMYYSDTLQVELIYTIVHSG